MNAYETIIINKTSVDDTKYTGFVKRIEDTIKEHGGKVLINDKWGTRRLAYPMQDEQSGCYTYVAYTGDNKLVPEIERQLRNLDYVLRYLSIQVGKKDEFNSEEFLADYKNQDWKAKSDISEGPIFSRGGGGFRGRPAPYKRDRDFGDQDMDAAPTEDEE